MCRGSQRSQQNIHKNALKLLIASLLLLMKQRQLHKRNNSKMTSFKGSRNVTNSVRQDGHSLPFALFLSSILIVWHISVCKSCKSESYASASKNTNSSFKKSLFDEFNACISFIILQLESKKHFSISPIYNGKE